MPGRAQGPDLPHCTLAFFDGNLLHSSVEHLQIHRWKQGGKTSNCGLKRIFVTSQEQGGGAPAGPDSSLCHLHLSFPSRRQVPPAKHESQPLHHPPPPPTAAVGQPGKGAALTAGLQPNVPPPWGGHPAALNKITGLMALGVTASWVTLLFSSVTRPAHSLRGGP